VPLSTKPFFTDNPGSIPYEYVVPATVELRVQSIVARFNGAAASGEFYPCLAIYTQDNHLLARIRTDQKFAVGDTGVVTWGPFLRQAAAAAAAAGSVSWANCAFQAGQVTTSGVEFAIATQDQFAAAGQSDIAAGNAANPFTILTDGVYIIEAYATWAPGAFADQRVLIGRFSPLFGALQGDPEAQEQPGDFDARSRLIIAPILVTPSAVGGSVTFALSAYQASGVAKTITAGYAMIARIGSAPAPWS
jgi:hypothetical protein